MTADSKSASSLRSLYLFTVEFFNEISSNNASRKMLIMVCAMRRLKLIGHIPNKQEKLSQKLNLHATFVGLKKYK